MVTLENEILKVEISPMGAEMQSVRRKDTGTEYLWQGDPAFWAGRAPNLFPFIGRLWNRQYTFRGQPYSMEIHGFLSRWETTVEEQTGGRCTFLLEDCARTREIYPFSFSFRLTYRLEGVCLKMHYRVDNRGGDPMYFALGGHPGIRLPLEPGLRFEDYRIRFPEKAKCSRITFGKNLLVEGETAYPLKEDRLLPLHRELFREDAVVLSHCVREVYLESEKGSRGVHLTFPDMPYFGIWQVYGKDAPYVCVEPWSALPGREETLEELTSMPGLWVLSPGASLKTEWTMEML